MIKRKGYNACLFLWGWGTIPGIALLYLQLYRVTCDQSYLLRSLDYVKRTLRNLNGRRVTFLCGDAGPLAVGAVVYHKLKSDCESQECITKWVFTTGSAFSKFSVLMLKETQKMKMTFSLSFFFFAIYPMQFIYTLFFLILFFNFTILYWFCHISTWICHRYTRVPHPEPSSLLPPHTIPLGCPSAPAPSIQYRASNLDWRLVSYMILYMFQCCSPKSSHPLSLPQSPKDYSIHQCLF